MVLRNRSTSYATFVLVLSVPYLRCISCMHLLIINFPPAMMAIKARTPIKRRREEPTVDAAVNGSNDTKNASGDTCRAETVFAL